MTVNIAVVGLGYWGPNLARNAASVSSGRLHTLCDMRVDRLAKAEQQYPGVKMQTDYREVLADTDVDAVIIATPVHTHFELAAAALRANKHVMIEKPMARTSAQCRDLITLAEAHHLVLMAGHVFIYNAAVHKVKEYICSGELGDIYYIYSQRLNLGIVRQDVNALWNFGPHDLSIFCYWLGKSPEQITAKGYSYIQPGIADVVFVTLDFPGGISGNMHLSWLDPNKTRRTTVVGSKKMVVYDDVSADAKITVYDSTVTRKPVHNQPIGASQSPMGRFDSFGEFQLLLHAGDVLIPKLNFVEPLKLECQHFVECISTGQRPTTDGLDGLRVVRALEAAQQSLETGLPVKLPDSRAQP